MPLTYEVSERARSSWTAHLWAQSGHLEKFGENMFHHQDAR